MACVLQVAFAAWSQIGQSKRMIDQQELHHAFARLRAPSASAC